MIKSILYLDVTNKIKQKRVKVSLLSKKITNRPTNQTKNWMLKIIKLAKLLINFKNEFWWFSRSFSEQPWIGKQLPNRHEAGEFPGKYHSGLRISTVCLGKHTKNHTGTMQLRIQDGCSIEHQSAADADTGRREMKPTFGRHPRDYRKLFYV